MKKIRGINGVIVSAMLIALSNGAYADLYSDVPYGYWAYKATWEITDKHIMEANSENLFRPEEYITREEYARAVIKALKRESMPIEKMYSFDDVKAGDANREYILRALNLDILEPEDANHFNPKGHITRTEFITFLVNILRSESITKKDALIALQNAYDDYEDIPDWFKVTAGKAEVLGVIAKNPDKERILDCDADVTRAEAAVFLYNMLEKINSYKAEAKRIATSPKKAEGTVIENTVKSGDVVTLVRGTVLPISANIRLESNRTVPGQVFHASFLNNIVNENHELIFSKDVVLTGRILDAKKAAYGIKNGSILIDLFGVEYNNNSANLYAIAECEAINTSGNKIIKSVKNTLKGKNLVITQEDVIYVKLYKPVRVNVVTGEIFD